MIPIINIPIFSIAKAFVIIGVGIYVAFALVVVRQVQLMTDTLEVGFELPIRILAVAHLLFALAALLLAIIIL